MEAQTKFILRFKPGHAPQRYVFSDPDTSRVLEAPTRKALLLLIESYRRQNDLEPLSFLSTSLDDYLCRLPENMGKCSPMKLDRSISATVKGGMTLLWKKLTKGYVDQGTADGRALICTGCPHNEFEIERPPFEAWLDRVAEQLVGKRRSIHHARLGRCGVCECVLRAKVWIDKPEAPNAEELLKMQAVGCWVPEASHK